MQITIFHRKGTTLYTTGIADDDTRPLRTVVERALHAGADLAGANLTDANLTDADLTDANLSGANLSGANLTGAILARADLTGAYLWRANLTYANLRGTDLTRANLAGADLTGAYLACADLAYANLARANLTGADLTGANLWGANLAGADLMGADLTYANLTVIREDVREILSAAPNEVKGLLEALQAGKVNGSAYEGECACLIGTIANVRGCSYKNVGITPNPDRPAERWFLGIFKGHTPENNPIAQITEQWIVEWMTGNAV